MDYTSPIADRMGAEEMPADDTAAGDPMTKIAALVTSIQAQLDELKAMMPAGADPASEDGEVMAGDEAEATDEAPQENSGASKALLMRAMTKV